MSNNKPVSSSKSGRSDADDCLFGGGDGRGEELVSSDRLSFRYKRARSRFHHLVAETP